MCVSTGKAACLTDSRQTDTPWGGQEGRGPEVECALVFVRVNEGVGLAGEGQLGG